MKQRQRKHAFINHMRNPESDHAATRRILRELRELAAALDAAGTPLGPSLRDDAVLSNGNDAWTGRDEAWEQMPECGREWPNEGWDQSPMPPEDAGLAAGLYDHSERHDESGVRYVAEDPDVMGGAPCFAGTRVPIDNVLASLDKGMSLEEVRKHYPFVTSAHVAAARVYVATHTRQGLSAGKRSRRPR